MRLMHTHPSYYPHARSIKNESDPRPGQRLMPHRNIIAHGHDRVTEALAFPATRSARVHLHATVLVAVPSAAQKTAPHPGAPDAPNAPLASPTLCYLHQVFLRVNLFSMQYEVGSWTGPCTFFYFVCARRHAPSECACARISILDACACIHAVCAGATDSTCLLGGYLNLPKPT